MSRFNLHGTQTGRMSSSDQQPASEMDISDLARELRTLVEIDGVTYRRSEHTNMMYELGTHVRIVDVLDSVFSQRMRVGVLHYDPQTHLFLDNFDLGIIGQDGNTGRAMLFATAVSSGKYLNTAKIAAITNSTKPWTFRVCLPFMSAKAAMGVRNAALRKRYGASVI